jgi:hypothetical protein
MISQRVTALGRYIGTVTAAVEVQNYDHRTFAYRMNYRRGFERHVAWFLARDVVLIEVQIEKA